jgi:hypothetical protein
MIMISDFGLRIADFRAAIIAAAPFFSNPQSAIRNLQGPPRLIR